jgi:hypothetical protein
MNREYNTMKNVGKVLKLNQEVILNSHFAAGVELTMAPDWDCK